MLEKYSIGSCGVEVDEVVQLSEVLGEILRGGVESGGTIFSKGGPTAS